MASTIAELVPAQKRLESRILVRDSDGGKVFCKDADEDVGCMYVE